MNNCYRRLPISPLVILNMSLLVASPVGADVLIYDGFGALDFGWGGSDWTPRGDAGGTVTFNPAASVDFSDYDDNFGTPGRAEFSGQPFSEYGIDRQFGTAPVNGETFYVSYVFEMLGEVDVNDFFDSGIAASANSINSFAGADGFLSAAIDENETGGWPAITRMSGWRRIAVRQEAIR